MNTSLRTILYAEDDIDIQQIAIMALEEVGKFSVRACSSGEEMIQAAKEFQADLVLIDVMMPGMDGPTTLQVLRKIPAYAKTPVIFITAKMQKTEIEYYKSLGAIDVVTKPFDPMTLSSTILDSWKKHHESQK